MNEDALKERLRVVAKEKGITFNETWKQLLLERFLARLAQSKHQEKFIFKGGLLLAQYLAIGRETTDALKWSIDDFKKFPQEVEIADDGVEFKTLPDGIKVVKRPITKNGPTLEFQPLKTNSKLNNRLRVKVRYLTE